MVFNKPFGRYSLVKKLASGGMAEVYLAIRRGPSGFNKLVALKCILPHVNDDQEHVKMFYNEANLGGLFRHPNLIEVFDADQIEGRHTMVMEFVEGGTVEELVSEMARRDKVMPVDAALNIVAMAALGLHHAHTATDLNGEQMHLVHRDISPHNILIGFDGRVKAFDFGLAVAAKSGDSGELAGKTAYMSPEQCRGRQVDARSDVFSLGIVLHELLTGQRLFERDNHIKAIRAVTEDPIPAPSSLRSNISSRVDRIAMRALDRNVNARYQSALELHHDISMLLIEMAAPPAEEVLPPLMNRFFRNQKAELEAVIEKVLLAPRQSEATIDLSTFDPRSAESRPPTGKNKIMTESGRDLDNMKTGDAPIVPSAPPLLAEQANAVISEQLQKARRNNTILGGVAAMLLVGVVGAFIIGQRSGTAVPDEQVDEEPAVQVSTTLVIETVPPGATVFVDGEQRAESTPAELLVTAGTEIEVSVSLPGFIEGSETITPQDTDEAQILAFEMAPDPNSELAPIGSVRVTYEPEDAAVFIDGEARGAGSPLVIEGLTLNEEHTLRLQKTGFETLYDSFRLNSTDTLDIQLQMAEAVDVGIVNITSSPSGAMITLTDADGNSTEIGETPIDNLELLAGQSWNLSADLSGYRGGDRRQVRVNADSVTEVEFNLYRPQATAPRDNRSAAAEPEESGSQGSTPQQPTTVTIPDPEPEPEPVQEEEEEERTYQLLD